VVEPSDLQKAFVQEVADEVRNCRKFAVDRLASGDPADAVVTQALNVLAHTLLVILDGGTKLSDEGRRVWLTDANGEVVGEGLHEWLSAVT
jgi:hypothetical protein